jgi:hypothetical protein
MAGTSGAVVNVIPIPGEATRFWVESSSLECTDKACGKLFSRLKHTDMRAGDKCPKCGAVLDIRYHLVDISAYWPIGRCTCEYYVFTLGPKVAKMQPSKLKSLTQYEAQSLRCSHIEAARTAALDRTIHAHQAVNGGAEREDGP